MSSFTKPSLLLLSLFSVVRSELSWTSCGTSLDCASLSIHLKWSNTSTSKSNSSLALIRYNANVPSSQRPLLPTSRLPPRQPGGPGAPGVQFVHAGAAAFSVLTGGFYDIIGFDPRGVGSTTPLLEFFSDAGAEYNFSSTFASGPNLWLGSFSNSSYDAQIKTAVKEFDTSVAALADACVVQDSPALYTSTTAYVARDMAAIVDTLDGPDAKLNYWAFSYGTIHLVEFIQTFPSRAGRIIADGVFDAEAIALKYVSQLPNDQICVRDAMNNFISFYKTVGSTNYPLSSPPIGITCTLKDRIDEIFEDLFLDYGGFSISLDTFASFLWSFQRVPSTWPKLSHILGGLETRNATLLMDLLLSQAASEPSDPSALGVSLFVLQCVDNADSTSITIHEIINLTKKISIAQDTPLSSRSHATVPLSTLSR